MKAIKNEVGSERKKFPTDLNPKLSNSFVQSPSKRFPMKNFSRSTSNDSIRSTFSEPMVARIAVGSARTKLHALPHEFDFLNDSMPESSSSSYLLRNCDKNTSSGNDWFFDDSDELNGSNFDVCYGDVKCQTLSSKQSFLQEDLNETDDDYTTDYSIKYKEQNVDEFTTSRRNHSTKTETGACDSVKIYQTEGTPLLFSLAPSLSDLSEIENLLHENTEKFRQMKISNRFKNQNLAVNLTETSFHLDSKATDSIEEKKKDTIVGLTSKLSKSIADTKSTPNKLNNNEMKRSMNRAETNNDDHLCDKYSESKLIVKQCEQFMCQGGSDTPMKFQTENTPAVFSHTSLSPISIKDDDDDIDDDDAIGGDCSQIYIGDRNNSLIDDAIEHNQNEMITQRLTSKQAIEINESESNRNSDRIHRNNIPINDVVVNDEERIVESKSRTSSIHNDKDKIGEENLDGRKSLPNGTFQIKIFNTNLCTNRDDNNLGSNVDDDDDDNDDVQKHQDDVVVDDHDDDHDNDDEEDDEILKQCIECALPKQKKFVKKTPNKSKTPHQSIYNRARMNRNETPQLSNRSSPGGHLIRKEVETIESIEPIDFGDQKKEFFVEDTPVQFSTCHSSLSSLSMNSDCNENQEQIENELLAEAINYGIESTVKYRNQSTCNGIAPSHRPNTISSNANDRSGNGVTKATMIDGNAKKSNQQKFSNRKLNQNSSSMHDYNDDERTYIVSVNG